MLEYFQDMYFEQCVPTDASLLRLWASLALWDLLCLAAVTQKSTAFSRLIRASYLLDDQGARVSVQESLSNLCVPLCKLLENAAPDEAVLGCQEVAADVQSMAALRAALPKGFQVYLRTSSSSAPDGASPSASLSFAESVFTGFIYSSTLRFKDVTDDLHANCRKLLEDLEMPSDVDDAVREDFIHTNLRRLCVGVFSSAPTEGAVGGRKIAVANLHLKSQKGLSRERAMFIRGLFDILFELQGVGSVVVLGDVNVDAPFPSKVTPAEQRTLVEASPLGHIPEQLVKAGPAKFDEVINGAGLRKYPEAASAYTCIKQRTMFQGQPHKAGEIAHGHKDVVIMSGDGSMSVVNTIIGGKDMVASKAAAIQGRSNLDMLMPSRDWQCDHFSTMCIADVLCPDGKLADAFLRLSC